MNSIKCPQCSLTNWADAQLCKRCGFELQVAPRHAGWQPGDNLQQGYSAQYYPSPPLARAKTGLAIASMVVGIAALVSCGFGILIAPVGLILGIVALVRASKHAHVHGGKGFAITGIVTSIVSLFVVVPIIAAIAIPNILAARRTAYEAGAMKNLSTLASAEQRYLISNASGPCADLASLGSRNLIDKELAKSEKLGYRYTVVNEQGGDRISCGIQATPISTGDWQSFYFSTQDGLMRAARKNGAPASQSDPLLGTELQQSRR